MNALNIDKSPDNASVQKSIVGGKKNKRAKTLDIIGIVVIALLIPVLVVNGVMLYKSAVNPDVPADFMGYIPLVSGSDDMTDFDSNDLVIVKSVEQGEALDEDTLICYMPIGRKSIVWERIVRMEQNADGSVYYIAKADADSKENPVHIAPSQIVGVYHSHINNVGAFVLFMQSQTGMITCVVAPICAIFLAFYLIDRKKYNDLVKTTEKAAEAEAVNAEAVEAE